MLVRCVCSALTPGPASLMTGSVHARAVLVTHSWNMSPGVRETCFGRTLSQLWQPHASSFPHVLSHWNSCSEQALSDSWRPQSQR